jgi:hypothetical protein
MSHGWSISMAERKNLSKSKRFEIFKRDGFICQYCGKQPPDVILEVDHIHPIAEGGDNDEMNLITSCYECNRGKGSKILGNVSPKPDGDLAWLEAQQEISELQRYQIAKQHRDQRKLEFIKSLQEEWMFAFQTSWCPSDLQLLQLINRVSPELIEKAIYLASEKRDQLGSIQDKFKYMCGIVWNIVRQGGGE